MQGIPHYRDQHFDKLKAAAAPWAVVCFRNVSSSLPCGFFSAVFFFYILFYSAVGFFLLLQVPAAAAAGLRSRLHSVRICVWCSINRIVTWCWPIIHSYQRKLRGWIELRSLLAQIAPVDWPARAEAPPLSDDESWRFARRMATCEPCGFRQSPCVVRGSAS